MTHRITTQTRIDFEVALADQVYISDGIFWPTIDNDIDLGDGTHEFKDAYFDGTVYSDYVGIDAGTIASSSVTVAPLRIGETYTGTAAEIAVLQYAAFVDARTIQNVSNQVLRFVYTKDAGANQSGSAYDAGIVVTGTFNADQASFYGIQSYGPSVANTKTITLYRGIDIVQASGAGAVTTQIGLNIGNMTKGGTNYAISTGTGYVWLGDDVGIGTSPSAQLHVDQSSVTGAQPVLTLDQADVDVVLMKIIGTAGAATTDRTLVAAADFGTPGALVGWIQIEIDDIGNRIADGDYYLPVYAAPT